MFTQKKKEYYSKILGFKTIEDFEKFSKRYLKYLENQTLTKNRIMTGFFILVEIQKEYHKEFLSEGVMFYYYKRTGTKTIPNYTEDMEDAQYVLPYPEFEIQSGRVQ
jgi:hypothetical protein